MKILTFIFACLSSFVAVAGGIGAIGKLTSGICNSSENQLFGSGVVVNVGGENVLVTSEHAVLAESIACHTLQIEGQKYILDFVMSDYRHGLALFKIRSGESLSSFPLDHLNGASSILNSTMIAVGYPVNSNSILIDKSVSSVSNSDRSLFADISKILEVKGLHAEKGMSGGALLSSDGDKLIGILTSLTAQSGITNGDLFLAIPAVEVKAWIMAALNGKTSTLRRDPRLQYSSNSSALGLKESVLGPGIRLASFEPNPSDKSLPRGGGDGMGVGGSNIEGDKIQITMTDFATFEMAKNSKELSWLAQIRQAFNGHPTVEVEKVVTFNSKQGLLEVTTPKNMSEFLKLMKNSNAIIVLKSDSAEKYNGQASAAIQRLLQSTEPLAQALGMTLQTLMTLKIQHPDLVIPESIVNKIKNHSELTELSTEESDGFDLVVSIQRELSTLSMTRPGL